MVTNPVLLGLDEKRAKLFDQHRAGYIYNGMIAANYFLSYLPFGSTWNRELQRSESLLPSRLQGRPLNLRIYKDSESLRQAQIEGLTSYKRILDEKGDGEVGEQ